LGVRSLTGTLSRPLRPERSGIVLLAVEEPRTGRFTGTSSRCRRVALAIESSEPGGAEQLVLVLADLLRASGHEPVVVTQVAGWLTERAERAGLPVWLAPQKPGLDPGWVIRFAGRLRRARIDLLHSHEFAMNVYGGAAARLIGIPSVATIHGRHWVVDRPRRVIAYRALLRLGMEIVAVSHDLAQYLVTGLGVPPGAVRMIHNGIPLDGYDLRPPAAAERETARSELGLPLRVPLVVAVGALFPVKDHAGLVRAVSGLEGVHLAIAGGGGEEAGLRRLAESLCVTDRVHLLGLRDDVPRVLRAADVFALSSRSEGLPLALLEAMAAGLPVVATRVGGVPEAVVDGATGHLVAPGDPAALAAGLARVLRYPEHAADLGRAGARRVEQEFSAAVMFARYWNLYQGRWAV
jgi:glycosyltransferase involved in cell wall biosynthesis